MRIYLARDLRCFATAAICGLLIFVYANFAIGQLGLRDPLSPVSINLREALELVEQNNRDLQIARWVIDKQNAREHRIFSLYLPKLDLSANQIFNFPEVSFSIPTPSQLPAEQSATTILLNPASQFDARLTLSQTILDLRALSSIRNANLETERVYREYASTKRSSYMEVVKAYYKAIQAQFLIDVAQNTLSRSKELLECTSQKHRRGLAKQIDSQKAEIEVVNAGALLANAQVDYDFAIAALGHSLGIDEKFMISPKVSIKPIEKSGSVELIANARSRREDLLAMQAALTSAKANLSRSWAEFFPVINASIQGSYSSNVSGFVTQPLRGAIVVQGTWALYDGGDRYGQLRETRAQISIEQIRLRDAQLRADSEIRGHVQNVEKKRIALESSTKKLKLQRTVYLEAQSAYRLGTIELLQLINSSRELSEFDLSTRNAAVELDLARLELANVAGLLNQVIDV